jgi:hypothetical protein
MARLQRCNQELLLTSIREHHLTWRETRTVVNALENEPLWKHEAILRDPRGSFLSPDGACPTPAEEKGLSYEAKKVLRRLFALERNCLEVALLVSRTDPIMFETGEEMRLRAACGRVLPSLARADEELRGMATYGKMGDP